MRKRASKFKSTLVLASLLISEAALSAAFVDMELSAFKANYNEVQIPNDDEGDRFEITDIDNGAIRTARLTLGWSVAENHELQFVLAPFSYTEKGSLDEDVRFNGETFDASENLEVRYQFSSYRVRYLYHLVDSQRWKTDIGATLFVRDASIKLSQNGTSTEDDNIGIVPLIAFRTAYLLNQHWTLLLDSDFAFAPQGRALDVALLAKYQFDKQWAVAAGYRTIEGGADNDEVYNFAWFNGATVKISYAW